MDAVMVGNMTLAAEPSQSAEAAKALNSSVFYLLVLITILLGYWIRQTSYKYATEGSVALTLGAITGGIICFYYEVVDRKRHTPHRLIEFDEDMFFQILLPPIIFSAGFSVKKKLFFRNFMTLMIFGVAGTMVTAAVLATTSYHLMSWTDLPHRHRLANAVSLGVVFSCTDSVATLQLLDKDAQPLLYSLLFGEGIVNDATAIVLLGATMDLAGAHPGMDSALQPSALLMLLVQFSRLFMLSLLLGLAFGMASAAVIRWLFRRPSPDREVLVVGLMGFMAYFVAEALELSAILAVFFCGIAMSHYTWHNLSPAAKVITRHGFHIIAMLCEVVLFVYAGLDMWVTALWPSQEPLYTSAQSLIKILSLSGGLLLAMMATRAAFTFPVVALANRWWRQRDPIPPRGGAVLWWGGLPRGAITLALTYHCFYRDVETEQEHKIIIAACVVVVAATSGGFGIITQPIMQALLGQQQQQQLPSHTSYQQQHQPQQLLADDAPPAPTPAGQDTSGSGKLRARMAAGSPAAACRAPGVFMRTSAGPGSFSKSTGGADSLAAPLLGGEARDGGGAELGPVVADAGGGPDGGAMVRMASASVSAIRAMSFVAAVDSDMAPAELNQVINDQLWEGVVPGVPPQQQQHEAVMPAVDESHAVLRWAGRLASGEGEDSSTWIHRQWRRLDAAFLQPIFGGSKSDGASQAPVTLEFGHV